MARVTCPECYVQYTRGDTRELRVCPNCGAPPVPPWRRMLQLGWPIPLLAGVLLQLIAGTVGRIPGAGLGPGPGPGAAASVSWFMAGTLVFALVAWLVLFAGMRAYRLWHRARTRRQRRRERAR